MLQVPKERIITLDACGMLSPALLTALVSSNRPQPAVSSTAAAAVRAAARKAGTGSSSSSVPVEGVALLLTLQLLVFLCAVCNVVSVCCSKALLAGLGRTLPPIFAKAPAPGLEWKHHMKACARSDWLRLATATPYIDRLLLFDTRPCRCCCCCWLYI